MLIIFIVIIVIRNIGKSVYKFERVGSDLIFGGIFFLRFKFIKVLYKSIVKSINFRIFGDGK